jgi:hypothetical protein
MLASAKAAGQIGHGSKSTGENQYKSAVVPNENNRSFTLEEAGISRKLSSRAQKIAAQLGLTPVIQTIEFGNGSDAKKLELAIASNTGAAALSKKDRVKIAEVASQHRGPLQPL